MTAAADTTPVDNFTHCHVGIVSHLQQLEELPALLEPARRARRIAHDALDFFRRVIREHHADEERELFPAVMASARKGDERERVQRIAERLTHEHRRLESAWAALEPGLEAVAKGHDSELNPATLAALVNDYQSHAEYEERVYLPLAQTILGRDGNHMAALGVSLHLRHAVPEFLAKHGHRG